jgi:hypothetical protein
MDSPGPRLRLSLLGLLCALVAAVALTGCAGGEEVVAGVRAPSILQAQEFVDEKIDEEPPAGWGKEQMLAQRSERQQERATAEEEELEGASQPGASDQGEDGEAGEEELEEEASEASPASEVEGES